MPRKKKVETTAEQTAVKAANAVAEVVEASDKKPTEKKTVAKKTSTAAEPKKTAAVKAESKVEVEAPAPAPIAKAEVFIEYGGAQVSVDEIVNNAKAVVGGDKDIKVYVKPDESKAYIAFEDQSVAMDVFFCE